MNPKSRRDPYFDNARFILVVLVVVGHFITGLHKDHELFLFINNYLSLFRMPALIIISGYFAKKFHEDGYIAKITKRVLIPYLFCQVIFSYYYYHLYDRPLFEVDLFHPVYTLWFLLSLFCWHLLLFIFSGIKHSLIVALILGVGIGYIESAGHYFSISRTFVFFPFFLLGYHLKKEHFEWLKKPFHRWTGLIAGAMSALILYSVMNHKTRSWILGRSSFEAMGYEDWYIGSYRLFFYILSLLAAYAFLVWIPKKQLFFTHMGQRTVYIYVLHGPVVKFIYTYYWNPPFEYLWQYLMVPLVAVSLAFFLGSKPIQILMQPLLELKIPKEYKHWFNRLKWMMMHSGDQKKGNPSSERQW